jgi:hypothetical protein
MPLLATLRCALLYRFRRFYTRTLSSTSGRYLPQGAYAIYASMRSRRARWAIPHYTSVATIDGRTRII